MVRLLSVDIEYGNKSYLALVSIRKKEQDLSCQIRYIDQQLQHIFPGDLLLINLEEGLKFPKDLPDGEAAMLVRRTTEAISKRLHAYS